MSLNLETPTSVCWVARFKMTWRSLVQVNLANSICTRIICDRVWMSNSGPYHFAFRSTSCLF
jgi:hypothetical protein